MYSVNCKYVLYCEQPQKRGNVTSQGLSLSGALRIKMLFQIRVDQEYRGQQMLA